jgi:hypothetical protein
MDTAYGNMLTHQEQQIANQSKLTQGVSDIFQRLMHSRVLEVSMVDGQGHEVIMTTKRILEEYGHALHNPSAQTPGAVDVEAGAEATEADVDGLQVAMRRCAAEYKTTVDAMLPLHQRMTLNVAHLQRAWDWIVTGAQQLRDLSVVAGQDEEGQAAMETMLRSAQAYIETLTEKSRIRDDLTDYLTLKARAERLRTCLEPAWMFAQASRWPSCCICMEQNANLVNVPCGHVLCTGCSKKLEHASACHICRSSVTLRQAFYL